MYRSFILTITMVICLLTFVYLYQKNTWKIETVAEKTENPSMFTDWKMEESELTGAPIQEDKNIYGTEPDSNIYDVYISVFPTKNAEGEMMNFSVFSKHQSGVHTFNPTLDCNIQILSEGNVPDPLTNLDAANAQIRVRGNSSRGEEYKNYKIKLQEDTNPFLGQQVLNFNKHSDDVSKITTKLAMDLMAKTDNMVSFRTYFMRVWIRDASLPKEEQEFKYYGLYTQIEQPNKTFLETHGLSSAASLYKARNFSFKMEDVLKNYDDVSYDETDFETVLGIREASDHQKLIEMVAAVNDTTNDFEKIFPIYFNEDNFVTWVAMNLLIGNNDIISHNYILYSPENSLTWYFLPWDLDGALRYGVYAENSVMLPDSLLGGQMLNQSVLFQRYFKIPGNREKIQIRMEELLANEMSEENVKEYADQYKKVLSKTLNIRPDISLLRMPLNEMDAYIDGIYGAMEANYQSYLIASEYPTPMYISVPTKNLDGTVHYSWDTSYSYQGDLITYQIFVATDYEMQNIVYEKKGVIQNQVNSEHALAPGTYYLRVLAVDSEGDAQISSERLELLLVDGSEINRNGIIEFRIE